MMGSVGEQKKLICRIGTSRIMMLTILLVAASSAAMQTSSAETDSTGQTTISGNLAGDPFAQDILDKIEQTKKMIAQWQQRQFENEQSRQQLEQLREDAIERLAEDLDEWERLWEKHSARNSFEKFVNKKPGYVQGVFWDQFEFKELKVDLGRAAMYEVLSTGGTMKEARLAYNDAATTQRIELVEMNSQFNVNHNLADYTEQQIFNSTGQIHYSALTQGKACGEILRL